jgi:hypothetical protein
MHSRFVRVRTACLCAVAIVAAACGGGSTLPEDGMLPIGFSERSATPYIVGTVTRRWSDEGSVRIHVRARSADARVPEAIVQASQSVLIKWRDGRTASLRDLRVGRNVMVWASGGEMRSMPPQVAANGILLTR